MHRAKRVKDVHIFRLKESKYQKAPQILVFPRIISFEITDHYHYKLAGIKLNAFNSAGVYRCFNILCKGDVKCWGRAYFPYCFDKIKTKLQEVFPN